MITLSGVMGHMLPHMRILPFLVGIFACIFPVMGQITSSKFTISPPPSWLRPPLSVISDGMASKDMVSDSIVYLVVDNQIRLGATSEVYSAYALKLLNEIGVQDNSTIVVNFDPTYQDLRFHSLAVRRGSNVIDKLRMDSFKILQREVDLEWRVLDGRLTAVAALDDIRVGDVLEYSYTIHGGNPVFEGRYADSFFLRWGTYVQNERLHIEGPASRTLKWKMDGVIPAPVVTEHGDEREITLHLEALDPVHFDSNLPSWYRPLPTIQFSEYDSWSNVVEWALRQYTSVTAAPPPILETELARWRQLPDDEQRFRAALRFVQDEIRYLGLELGPNSYRPNPPDLIIQRRFGDCKDKVTLLCSLLHALGIKAYPALVSVYARQTISDRLPSPLVFDHVIVLACIDSTDVWADPTRSQQRGGVNDLYLPDYGKALVVRSGEQGLTVIPGRGNELPLTHIKEKYEIRTFSTPCLLNVETIYTGKNAESIRASLISNTRQSLEKQYLNYYAQRFPGVTAIVPPDFQDDEEHNRITIIEKYSITNFWKYDQKTSVQKFSVTAEDINLLIYKPATVLRSMPLAVVHPTHVHQTIDVLLPQEWPIENDSTNVENAFFRFDFYAASTNRTIHLDYDFQTLADFVPPGNTAAYLEDLDRVRDSLSYNIWQTINSPSKGGEDGTIPLFLRINWSILMIALLYGSLLCAGWFLLYQYRPAPVQTPPDLYGPRGLGGWLILVAIGTILIPIMLTVQIVTALPAYSLPVWKDLTNPASALFNPAYKRLLIFELLANMTLLAFALLLIPYFFQKRRLFPMLMIIRLVGAPVLGIVDFVLAADVIDSVTEMALFYELMKGLVQGVIWIPYMVISRRVKNTFRN